MKKKILWFSNKVLDLDTNSSGTWLIALSNKLTEDTNIELYNITIGNVDKISTLKSNKFVQYVVPLSYIGKRGFISNKHKREIINIVDLVNPHLIHVWGVELFWGLVTIEIKNRYKILLEIQGIKGAIADVYSAGLKLSEKIQMIHLKEIIKLSNIFTQQKSYYRWGKIEEKIIKNHDNISIHSTWANSIVNQLNTTCRVFQNERLLRVHFYNAQKWKPNQNNRIFTSLGYAAPFKGLHTVILALSIIKEQIPTIKLVIAGNIITSGIRTEGYIKYILKLIKKNNLENNVEWLGGLNSQEMINEMQNSSICILPSFIESYGLALAESMIVGLPTIAAYNGGYGYLGRDEKNVFFFPPGDYRMCAFNALRVLNDVSLQMKLSNNAIKHIEKNNDPEKVINKELEIYYTILGEKNINNV